MVFQLNAKPNVPASNLELKLGLRSKKMTSKRKVQQIDLC